MKKGNVLTSVIVSIGGRLARDCRLVIR